MRLNTTLGRTALIAAACFAVIATVSFGGRLYLDHLNDPPADPPPTTTAVEVNEVEVDEVGTCYDLVPDGRAGTQPGAQQWTVVHCSSAHTAEVVATVAIADTGLGADTTEWGREELNAATQVCADAHHSNRDAATYTGESPTITAAVRGEHLMCVATSPPHRHLNGERVEDTSGG